MTRHHESRLSTTLLSLGWCALATTQAGFMQQPLRALDGTFEESINVTVVNVDVVVEDAKGRPIFDLEADDFEVFEDGRQVAINFFAGAGKATTATGEHAAPSSAATTEEVALDVAPVGRYFALFIDHRSIFPHDRKRMLRQLAQFLASDLREEDRVTVMSFDGGVRVEQPFTADLERVTDAFERVLQRPSGGPALRRDRARTRRQIIETLTVISDSTCSSELTNLADAYALQEGARSQQTLEALRASIDSLAALPGRKALLFVSGGLPLRPGLGLYQLISESCLYRETSNPQANVSSLLDEVAAHAAGQRVIFHGLQPAGAPTFDPSDQRATVTERQLALHNSRDPLTYLAQATGGTSIFGTSRFEDAFAAIGRSLDATYSLGYETPSNRDGSEHRIEVRVKRPGLRVRHRTSFRDETISDMLAAQTRAALLQGAGANPWDVAVEVGTMVPIEEKRVQVDATVVVPLAAATFLPTAEGSQARLRLLFALEDADGYLSPVREIPIKIATADSSLEAAQRRSYRHELQLIVRVGVHRLVVGIHDDHGRALSFTTTSLHAP